MRRLVSCPNCGGYLVRVEVCREVADLEYDPETGQYYSDKPEITSIEVSVECSNECGFEILPGLENDADPGLPGFLIPEIEMWQ